MTPARALLTLVALSGVAIAAGSCGGPDEATGKGSGGAGGGLIEAGASAGGSAGGSRAGSGGSGGSAGTGGAPGGSRLGQACVNDGECDPDGSTGLTCMTATETDLDGTAPPRGLCTMECSAHETCWQVDANGLCVQFGDGVNYCVEGCFQGEATDPLAPPKCHNRPQWACTPLDTFPIDQTCTELADCPSGHACYMGECVVVLAACLPACTGDKDCAAGMFCDREIGSCVMESTAGEPLGTACDPDATERVCSGFCQRVSDLPNVEGMCAEGCSFLNACNDDANDDYQGACLFTTSVNEEPDVGDFGYCAQLCDCSEQCNTPGFGCIEIEGLNEFYGRPGLCLYPFEEDGGMSETLETCPSGGGSGNGGTGNGGTGNGGQAGDGS